MADEGSILDIRLDELPDLEVVDDDTEITVSIKSHDVVPVKSANDPEVTQISVRLEPTELELVDDIYAYVPIPNAKDQTRDKKTFVKQCQRLKAFCDCFGIDYSTGVNLADLNGSQGSIIAGIDKDLEGRDRNRVKRWVTPA